MQAGDDDVAARLRAIEGSLAALERAAEDFRRRQLAAELRRDPARLLTGVADVHRIAPEALDELVDVLSRWDKPLSRDERAALFQASLVAQGITGSASAKVHLVVDVVTRVELADVERVAARARIFLLRSRRAIPVVIGLHPAPLELATAAADLGVELLTDC